MATNAADLYGPMHVLKEGGPVAWTILGIMILMSVVSWYIMITKWVEQRGMYKEAAEAEKKVWTASSLKEGATKLPKDSAFRQLADDGLRAYDHHEGKLTDQIDQHEWVTMTLNRTSNLIGSRLNSGLSFLASVGATAPFIGLLGTVIGIYNALVKIAGEGQASIDKVAGPVGEALIMTAIGLFVAVPAVLAYNFLAGRNKVIMEKLGTFAADVHGYLLSGSRMARPVAAAPTASAAKPVAK